jgi:hypothetical protein
LTGGSPSQPFFDLNSDGVVDQAGNSDKVSISAGGVTTYLAPAGKFLGTGVWSHPLIAKVTAKSGLTYFNSNPNAQLPSTPSLPISNAPSSDRGVTGGHFDFDLYYNVCDAISTAKGAYKADCHKLHIHEYDDIYDVVGVNFLKASDPGFNLVNAIPSSATTFKLLLVNQAFSPAAQLTIGSVTRAVWAWPLSPEGFVANVQGGAATVFTQASIGKLIISLPLNAFSNREWVPGSGDIRAGLTPSTTGCVQANQGAQGSGTNPWMNGALTLQIVKGDTTASAVERNQSSNVNLGYRLKKDTTSQSQQLAQYTMFWHHPNGMCYGDSEWTKTPASDSVSDAAAKLPAAGSEDPKGTFANQSGDLNGSSSGTGSITTYNGVEAYVTVTYNSATDEYTITIRQKSNDVILHSETSRGGSVVKGPPPPRDPPRLGRMSWQEIVR